MRHLPHALIGGYRVCASHGEVDCGQPEFIRPRTACICSSIQFLYRWYTLPGHDWLKTCLGTARKLIVQYNLFIHVHRRARRHIPLTKVCPKRPVTVLFRLIACFLLLRLHNFRVPVLTYSGTLAIRKVSSVSANVINTNDAHMLCYDSFGN